MEETKIIDANDKPVKVGALVLGTPPGRVIEIGDPDGDVDDEGRQYGIAPHVSVRYADGVEDSYSTFWTATGPYDEGAPYRCDDIEVAP